MAKEECLKFAESWSSSVSHFFRLFSFAFGNFEWDLVGESSAMHLSGRTLGVPWLFARKEKAFSMDVQKERIFQTNARGAYRSIDLVSPLWWEKSKKVWICGAEWRELLAHSRGNPPSSSHAPQSSPARASSPPSPRTTTTVPILQMGPQPNLSLSSRQKSRTFVKKSKNLFLRNGSNGSSRKRDAVRLSHLLGTLRRTARERKRKRTNGIEIPRGIKEYGGKENRMIPLAWPGLALF